MKPKTLAKIVGWVISIACIIYFIRHLKLTGLVPPPQGLGWTSLFVLTGSLIYGAGNALLGRLWSKMVPDAPTRELFCAYLIGQFAKYLPGNVMHYAARHGLAIRAGATHSAVAAAALAELYLLLCASAALALLLGQQVLHQLLPALTHLSRLLAIIPLTAAFAISVPGRIVRSQRWLPRLSARQVTSSLSGYLVFFLMFGVLYWLCLAWMAATPDVASEVIGSAIVAWVLGFVVPGAPAGAGLRETVLAIAPQGTIPLAAVSGAIILFRLITLCGDLFAFFLGLLIARLPSTSPPTDPQSIESI